MTHEFAENYDVIVVGAGHAGVQPRPEKRRGENYQGDDAVPAGDYGGACGTLYDAFRRSGGAGVLPVARFFQADGKRYFQRYFRCDGLGVFYPEHRYGVHCHLWQLY